MAAGRILNLNFHGIGRPLGRDFGEGEREFWASHETFEAALDAAATRDDISLSFDDGNSTDIDFALPALQERNLKATFFIVPAWLGEPGFMTKANVRELASAGMTIGNHGFQHRFWDELDQPSLEREVQTGRQLLEELIGARIDTLAVPYGRYNDFILGALRHDTYTHVFTSDGGAADPDGWLQPREHVRAEQTPDDVQKLLESVL